jgi:putative membrane protein insertion efficiency factor
MKKALLIAVRMYQVWLGPLLGGACRYYPSCSHYAVEAIERHGARRGLALALRRVLRCHPFSAGGIDLVPETESTTSAASRGQAAQEELAR